MSDDNIVNKIMELFEKRGSSNYGGEAVSQLEHALQAATLARKAGSSSELVCAALMHDIGHLIEDPAVSERDEGNLDDQHEERGFRWLGRFFGPAIVDPVRLHVAAKRYLCTVDQEYLGLLSPASLQSYHDQGGEMSSEEVAEFETEPNRDAAVLVRRWDDNAKTPGLATPTINDFVADLEAVVSTVQ